MWNDRRRTILIGASVARAGIFLAISLGLSIGLYVLLNDTGKLEDAFNTWLSTNYNLIFAILLLLVLVVASTYRNSGVLVGAALPVAPLLGYFLSGNIATVGTPTLRQYVHYGLQGGLLYGVPVGIVGYLFGRGLAYILETRPIEWSGVGR